MGKGGQDRLAASETLIWRCNRQNSSERKTDRCVLPADAFRLPAVCRARAFQDVRWIIEKPSDGKIARWRVTNRP